MDSLAIATLGGYQITIGVVVSFFVKWMKRWKWLDDSPVAVKRVFVAALCLGLTVLSNIVAHAPLSANLLMQAFLSYITASATYEHDLSSNDASAPAVPQA